MLKRLMGRHALVKIVQGERQDDGAHSFQVINAQRASTLVSAGRGLDFACFDQRFDDRQLAVRRAFFHVLIIT
ncbi:hypothetical protein FACS1894158_01250 [Betaproteobacteria bacterium]|nr:hypothetical protein FACS1894158_01250 [Betaproteobacteria bacterium]